jgi:hypothetical protein
LGVTTSLDGFAEDSNGNMGALYPDLDALRNTESWESIHTTGSVVMAWKEFAMAEDPDWFAGNYEYQVPLLVLQMVLPVHLFPICMIQKFEMLFHEGRAIFHLL